MNDFWKNLAALLKVKTIVTMVVIFVFSSMALAGKFQPDTVMTVVIMVISFYFVTGTLARPTAQTTIPRLVD